MALVKKCTTYHLVIRIDGRQVWVASGTESKTRAREIERQIVVACRSRDFRSLDADARCVTIALFENQGWPMADGRAESVALACGTFVALATKLLAPSRDWNREPFRVENHSTGR